MGPEDENRLQIRTLCQAFIMLFLVIKEVRAEGAFRRPKILYSVVVCYKKNHSGNVDS